MQGPISLIVMSGAELLYEQPTKEAEAASNRTDVDPNDKPAKQSKLDVSGTPLLTFRGIIRVLLFWAIFGAAIGVLILLSDASLHAFPDHPCMSWLVDLPSAVRFAQKRLSQPLHALPVRAKDLLAWMLPLMESAHAVLDTTRQVQ